MFDDNNSPSAASPHHDRGFTLVELLIVIVILGILATVTVFAVRGITEKGQENGEVTDLRTLETAADAYYLDNGENPTEQELVDSGYLTELSTMHDLTVGPAGSYEIVNLRTGDVVGTESGAAAAGGAGGGGGGAIPAASATAGTSVTVGGIPMLRYGPAAATRPHYIIGGPVAAAQWNAAVDANTPIQGAYTFLFIDIANITDVATATTVRNVISSNWGMVFSAADDVANFDGTAGSMYDAIENANGNPITWARINPGGLGEVADLFAQP